MKLLSLLGSVAFGAVILLPACGGSSDTELFGSSSGATGTSGGASSGSASSGGSSSGSTSSGSTSSGSTSSGSTSSGASGSSGTSTSGGPPPQACQSPVDCQQGEYCKLAACPAPGGAASGVCTKKPASESDPTLAPVCGCNGITYWNADVAAFHGANVSGTGPCGGQSAVKCGALQGCQNDTRCNFDQKSKQQCNVATPTGTCWMLPDACPESQGAGRACLGNACSSYCKAIEQEQPFYKVGSCL